jgi:hypothetical protein
MQRYTLLNVGRAFGFPTDPLSGSKFDKFWIVDNCPLTLSADYRSSEYVILVSVFTREVEISSSPQREAPGSEDGNLKQSKKSP